MSTNRGVVTRTTAWLRLASELAAGRKAGTGGRRTDVPRSCAGPLSPPGRMRAVSGADGIMAEVSARDPCQGRRRALDPRPARPAVRLALAPRPAHRRVTSPVRARTPGPVAAGGPRAGGCACQVRRRLRQGEVSPLALSPGIAEPHRHVGPEAGRPRRNSRRIQADRHGRAGRPPDGSIAPARQAGEAVLADPFARRQAAGPRQPRRGPSTC